MRKEPGDGAFRVFFGNFPRCGWNQRLADFNRFSSVETRSRYSCLVLLYLHDSFLFFICCNCLKAYLKANKLQSPKASCFSSLWKRQEKQAQCAGNSMQTISWISLNEKSHYIQLCFSIRVKTIRGHFFISASLLLPLIKP